MWAGLPLVTNSLKYYELQCTQQTIWVSEHYVCPPNQPHGYLIEASLPFTIYTFLVLILWGQICVCAIQIAFCISSPHKHPDDGYDVAVGEYDEDHLDDDYDDDVDVDDYHTHNCPHQHPDDDAHVLVQAQYTNGETR